MRKLTLPLLLLLLLPHNGLAQVAPECQNYDHSVDFLAGCILKAANEYDSPARVPLRLKSEGQIGSDLKIHLHLKTNEAAEKLRINKLRTQFYNTEFCAYATVSPYNMALGGAFLSIGSGFDPEFAVTNLRLPDHSCAKKISPKWGRVITGDLETMAFVEHKEVKVCFQVSKKGFTPSKRDYRRAQNCPYNVRNYLSRYYIGRNKKTLRQITLTKIQVAADPASTNDSTPVSFTVDNGRVSK